MNKAHIVSAWAIIKYSFSKYKVCSIRKEGGRFLKFASFKSGTLEGHVAVT